MLVLLAMLVALICAVEMQKKKDQACFSAILCLAHFDIMRLSFTGCLLCILLIRVLLRLCRSIRFLNIKSSLCLGMLLAKFLLLDEQAHNQPERREAHIHDPHRMQALCECRLSNMLLCFRKTVDEIGIGTSTASCQLSCDFWTECCYKAVCLCVHLILVYDLADDDRDGGEDLADETESCSCCGDISGLNVGLKGDQGGLEVGTWIQC